MKLKNKKTGEIVEWFNNTDGVFPNSLAELNEEWKDYEEPKDKGYWYIDDLCRMRYSSELLDEIDDRPNNWMIRKLCGNYFDTREEAEKAVRKLKAWHKLMDYWGTEILGWEIRDMPTGGNWQTVNVKFNVKARKEPVELLDILFGGEE